MSTPSDNPPPHSEHVTSDAHHPAPLPPGEAVNNPAVRHQGRDEQVGYILWTGVAMIVSAVAIHLIIWGMQSYYWDRATRRNLGASPLAVAEDVEIRNLPQQERMTARITQIPPPRLDSLEPLEGKHPLTRSNPRLQVLSQVYAPWDLRAQNWEALTTFGPSMPAARGYTRVPIDRVMQMLASPENAAAKQLRDRWLPVRGQPLPQQAPGLRRPSESNSGNPPRKEQ